MKTLARPALRSAATSISTMAGVRIRALTERHPIKPTSPRCHSAWQLNLGRHSTYRRGKSVQTTGTTSCDRYSLLTYTMLCPRLDRVALIAHRVVSATRQSCRVGAHITRQNGVTVEHCRYRHAPSRTESAL